MNSEKAGIGSALLASVCCAGPVLLAALGLGGLGLGTFIGAYHWYFLGASGLVLTYAWYGYLKRRHRCATGQCAVAGGRFTGLVLTLSSLAVAGFLALNITTYTDVPAQADGTTASAAPASVVLPVEGMTCFTCTITVENSLEALPGVDAADASVPGKSVTVRYDPQRVTVHQMVAAVNGTGYRARPPAGNS